MTEQLIIDWQMGIPAGWGQIPPTMPVEEPWTSTWSQDVARKLADDRHIRRLAKRLRALHKVLTRKDVVHTGLAVWVPDRGSGEIAAHVEVDGMAPDPGVLLTREYVRGLLGPERHRVTEVFHHDAEDVDLPAGPALFVSEVLGGHLSGPKPNLTTVQERVTVVIFPAEAADALHLTFVAHGVDVNEEGLFDNQVWACVNAVSVTLGAGTL